jgi:DNA-binding transcriptional MerR regulator
MSDIPQDIVIPNRRTFKPAEVCELLKVQPYVLRTWENEFKDLGVAQVAGAPRVYRRKDVELAVRIRQLVFGEGLTLAGARRRLESERPSVTDPDLEAADVADAQADVAAPRKGLDDGTRHRLRTVRDELRALLAELSAVPAAPASSSAPEFTLEPLDVVPHVADDEAVVVEAGKGGRKRRGRS